MTNNEILSAADEFIDDTLSATLKIPLANQAKTRLEAELKLEITKKLDTSKTSTVGGTYLTSIDLPADILVPLGHIYVGTTQRRGIPFEHRMAFKDSPGYFYVDLATSHLYLTGTIAKAETITIPYIYKTTAIAATDTTAVVWPEDFHLLIAMEMAKIWYAVDQGEKTRSYAPEWQAFYNELKNSLINWDSAWKLSAIGHSTPYGEADGNEVPLSMM